LSSPSGGSIGIGFAIPSEIATGVVDQLRQFGQTRRGWLGVRIQPVTPEVAQGLGMTGAKGALVAGVDDPGPAAAAGIKAGDVILSFGGVDIDAVHALPLLVADQPVGKEVPVVVLRDGMQQTLNVKLGSSTRAASRSRMPPRRRPPPSRARQLPRRRRPPHPRRRRALA